MKRIFFILKWFWRFYKRELGVLFILCLLLVGCDIAPTLLIKEGKIKNIEYISSDSSMVIFEDGEKHLIPNTILEYSEGDYIYIYEYTDIEFGKKYAFKSKIPNVLTKEK